MALIIVLLILILIVGFIDFRLVNRLTGPIGEWRNSS